MVNQVGANPIICSGVSVGTTDLVLNYIDQMATIVSGEESSKDLKSHFPQCERNGVDQGVHNVLVYKGKIPNMKRWDQRTGPVANMQARLAKVQDDHSVVNSKGDSVAVVHQYDRFPDLQKHLFSNFVDWVNTNDFKAEWAATEQCQEYKYKENMDLFKG